MIFREIVYNHETGITIFNLVGNFGYYLQDTGYKFMNYPINCFSMKYNSVPETLQEKRMKYFSDKQALHLFFSLVEEEKEKRKKAIDNLFFEVENAPVVIK